MEKPTGLKALTAALERAQPLDPPAETLQKGVAALFEGAGAAGLKVRDFLHGVWFGHPLHPVLVAIPVGAWTAAAVLDACEGLAGRRDLAPGADAAIAVGIAGAVGSAATGITDWHHLDGARRRVGFVHGLLNAIALLLYTGSLVCRLRGRRRTGHLLALLGLGTVSVSGYLGGELSYSEGIGVDHAKIEWPPDRFVPVLPEAELREGQPRCAVAAGVDVLLVRQNGQIHALMNQCAHLGGPLHEGKLGDGTIECPWHGSVFGLADGQVRLGPSTFPQPVFETRVRDGMIEVKGNKA